MKEFKQYLIDREIRNGVYVYSVWQHRVCGMYQQISAKIWDLYDKTEQMTSAENLTKEDLTDLHEILCKFSDELCLINRERVDKKMEELAQSVLCQMGVPGF